MKLLMKNQRKIGTAQKKKARLHRKMNKYILEIESKNKQQAERIKELEAAIKLYIVLVYKRQFTPPEKIKRIGEIIGEEIKDGYVIWMLIQKFEDWLKGGD